MAAIMNYNGRGDVSSARANAALGVIIVDNTVLRYYLYAIINVTRTYMYVRIFIRCARALALRAEKRSEIKDAVNF